MYGFIGFRKLLNGFACLSHSKEPLEIIQLQMIKIIHQLLVREDKFEGCSFRFGSHIFKFINIWEDK